MGLNIRNRYVCLGRLNFTISSKRDSKAFGKLDWFFVWLAFKLMRFWLWVNSAIFVTTMFLKTSLWHTFNLPGSRMKSHWTMYRGALFWRCGGLCCSLMDLWLSHSLTTTTVLFVIWSSLSSLMPAVAPQKPPLLAVQSNTFSNQRGGVRCFL